MEKLKNNTKFAVVTGASSGIGLEFAKILASDNYNLLLVSRDKDQLSSISKDLEQTYNVDVNFMSLDLSNIDSSEKLWQKVENKHIDIFINNAGFGDFAEVVDADWLKLESMISLNITTLTRLSQLAAQHMKKAGKGKILNVASIAAFFPGAGMATYYATKAYVLSFSEALSEELNGSGVTVTALCPGPTKSGFAKSASMQKSTLMGGKLPSSKQVAEYGYRALKDGKVVAVHGFSNKVGGHVLTRILPRFMIRKYVKKTNYKRIN